jgi:ferrochelatase
VATRPFDAVLLISFGGPQGPADIRPFLQNVLRGRRVPPERVDVVAHHYERFGGVSPLTQLTLRQARGLEARLLDQGLGLPVFVGMRNWHPFLDDTLQDMRSRGVERAIGVITAAHRHYSSCGQYRQNVLQAREALTARGVRPPTITYVGDWFVHPGFVSANADRIRAARDRLPQPLRRDARLVFTAHSIPALQASEYPYERQLRASAELVARELGIDNWVLVFQSRSGRPQDPWLEPDVNDYLRAARAEGVEAVVVSPIGFVCDHLEVLYDLDVEAAQTAREVGLAMTRAESVNDHPAFLDALADVVRDTWARYSRGTPVSLVNAERPVATELPPPTRG